MPTSRITPSWKFIKLGGERYVRKSPAHWLKAALVRCSTRSGFTVGKDGHTDDLAIDRLFWGFSHDFQSSTMG